MTTMQASTSNRILRAAYNWGPIVVGCILGAFTPWWMILLELQIVLPSVAVSLVCYLLLAKSGKRAVFMGLQTAVAISFFLALPAIVS